MSYSPTVHSSSRTFPPTLSTSREKSAARCAVSRKFLMPCSVQLIKDTYVAMLVPPATSELSDHRLAAGFRRSSIGARGARRRLRP